GKYWPRGRGPGRGGTRGAARRDHRQHLRCGGAPVRPARAGRLLGAVVRPLPRARQDARRGRRRARRPDQDRQGQHRRGAAARRSPRSDDGADGRPLQGRQGRRQAARRGAAAPGRRVDRPPRRRGRRL
ncbi:MAG: Thioredoxin, partial [uncultured Thermomicrobiales bacterium]